jgi:hypothetical protein
MAKIDINSNIVRVDFVEALASQLKLQMAQVSPASTSIDVYRKVQSKLDAVDQAVKSGDPQKAELALFEAQTAVKESQITTGATPESSKGVDAYA